MDVKKEVPFIERVRERLKKTIEAWDKQYQLSIGEINFLSPANQWPEDAKSARVGKPTIASDRLNAQVKQICNQQRDNRPAICFHAVNSDADEDTANILQGIVRHIEYESRADLAYDTAFEHAVEGGIGFIRLLTEYEEGSFDQRIKIESVPNPFMVYIDPTFKQPDGSDIQYAFVMDLLSYDAFKEEYPDSELSNTSYRSWLQLATRFPEWFDNDSKATLVVEYFEKTNEWYKLVKLKNGDVKDKADCTKRELTQIESERDDCRPVVKWYKMCALEVLEETEWIGKDIPIIPVFGDVILDNGNRMFSGLVRNNKETQVMLNTIKTVTLEMIARAPKNPWLVPEGSIDDHKDEWASVNVLDLPYLTYKTKVEGDDNPLPPPQRMTAEPPIQGMLAVMQTLENDIKATAAIFDPTMGNKMANDQSGVAIKALQTAGSVAHYNYSDNLTRALRVLGDQILDLIRKIFTEPQVVRIVGLDDKHTLVGINGEPNPEGSTALVDKAFDVTVGKYNVTVDSGPSYQTKREENLNKLLMLASKDPQLMAIAGDLIIGQMDFPASQELVKRMEKALPPALQPKPDNGEIDPQAMKQQLDQAHQIIQQLTQVLQKETQLADSNQLKLKIAQLQAQTELSKHQSQMQHDSNKALLEAQMAELRGKTENSHELLKLVADHVLKKDRHKHETGMDMIKTAHEASLEPQEPPVQTMAPLPAIPPQTYSAAPGEKNG